MSKEKFLRGAFILTAAGIGVKIIGSVNRILLSRFLGGEGIGLYQMAYPIYLLAISVSSAGIPVAISIMVAEKLALNDHYGAKRVFRIALAILSVTGVLFSFLLYNMAGWIIEEHFVRDIRAYWALVALAPAIFFVTLEATYRGYFQGMQMMVPTAVSQVWEQLVRVFTMIFFAYILMHYGLEYAAAGATFGACPGAVAGLLVLLYYYFKYKKVNKNILMPDVTIKQDSVLKISVRIFKLALPVSLANIMLPIVAMLDMFIVPLRLEVAGFAVEKATEQFGFLTGMAVPLINMATILTASLAISLVPAVSEAFTLKNMSMIREKTASALHIANIITIPASVGLWLLATPISKMLYGTFGADWSIAIMSVGIFLLGVQQITTGVLQGLGKTAIPVINMLISALFKVVFTWILTAMPQYGIKGAAWATNIDFGLAALLNIFFVYKYTGFAFDLKRGLRITLASLGMGAVVYVMYHGLMHVHHSLTLVTMLSILAGCVVYILALVVAGGVTLQDIEKMPKVGLFLSKKMQSLRFFKDRK